ncbi:hypothetical protein OOZ19_21250 [Saccharopolyspora sp. NFXS83]|uniref:hypothetical protein n=1 Tax=Saccharopolyspora sp. NFXS83 TaxID=2993560 RepID=UPI00224B5396|nr:hypothetical protein [Saccharopolyspora sp. NFXS83]MCX2732773.1 hypothetical protein [Saccharopolyspora sp. NFXS83]
MAAHEEDSAWTVYVSDALQARLDTYCGDDGTPTAAVFEAIEALRDRLPDVVRGARARLQSPHARDEVHYLGSGPVQIRIHPDAARAALLDRLSDELDVPITTWLPPLLNAHLPGRQEPDNMPWIVQDPAER